MPNPLIGGTLESDIARSYNSFAGSDIKAVIGTKQFAEIQAVSYSVTREKAPIYTMGSPDPRAFARNKRGIAGSLIWVNFDRHALLDLIWTQKGQFVSNIDDISPAFTTEAVNSLAATGAYYETQQEIFGDTLVRGAGAIPPVSATIDQLDRQLINSVSGLEALAYPWYSD